MTRKQKRILTGTWKTLVLTAVCLFFIAPYLWMVLISLKPKVDIFDPGKFIFTPTLQNYTSNNKNAHILDYFANSMIVSVISTAVYLAIGSVAAYGFARFNWKKRDDKTQNFCPMYLTNFELLLTWYLESARLYWKKIFLRRFGQICSP